MKRPVFDRTLSMAETALLQVWNTKILLPLNADNENGKDSKNFLIVKRIKPWNKPCLLQKKKRFSCVNLFPNIQKQQMSSHNCLWTCIAVIAYKTAQLDATI